MRQLFGAHADRLNEPLGAEGHHAPHSFRSPAFYPRWKAQQKAPVPGAGHPGATHETGPIGPIGSDAAGPIAPDTTHGSWARGSGEPGLPG